MVGGADRLLVVRSFVSFDIAARPRPSDGIDCSDLLGFVRLWAVNAFSVVVVVASVLFLTGSVVRTPVVDANAVVDAVFGVALVDVVAPVPVSIGLENAGDAVRLDSCSGSVGSFCGADAFGTFVATSCLCLALTFSMEEIVCADMDGPLLLPAPSVLFVSLSLSLPSSPRCGLTLPVIRSCSRSLASFIASSSRPSLYWAASISNMYFMVILEKSASANRVSTWRWSCVLKSSDLERVCCSRVFLDVEVFVVVTVATSFVVSVGTGSF